MGYHSSEKRDLLDFTRGDHLFYTILIVTSIAAVITLIKLVGRIV